MPDAGSWICIAAYHDWHPGVPPGKVKVVATKNAHTRPSARRRSFLVDEDEYNRHPWPMTIATNKHEEVFQ